MPVRITGFLMVCAALANPAGAQFSQPLNVSNRGGYWDTMPSVDRDAGNNLHLAWKSWNDQVPTSIWYANNIGGFWKKQEVTSSGFGMPGNVCLVVTPDQVIHIYYSTAGGDWHAYELSRPVSGGPWSGPTQRDVLDSDGSLYMQSAARDTSGGICMMYVTLHSSGWNLHTRYKPLGGNYGNEELVRGGGSGTSWPQAGWITSKDDLFFATYYITGSLQPYYKVRSAGGSWGQEVPIAPRGFGSNISFSPTGQWALTWYDDRQNCDLDFTIYTKFSDNQGASWGQTHTVSTSCWLSRNPSTVYDANGDFFVSYERLDFDGAPWDVWTRARINNAWGADTNLTDNPGGVRGFSPPKAFTVFGNNLFHFYTNTTANLYEDVWFRARWAQPQIVLNAVSLERTTYYGHNVAPNDTLTVSNGGIGSLSYTAVSDTAWLQVSPGGGSAPSASSLLYDTILLPPGVHTATVTVSDPAAFNNPQRINVSVTVKTVQADFDGDGDVDQTDFGQFQQCLSGATIPQPRPECQPMKFDADEDVDANDFAALQGCMSGANIPADPNCD